MIAVEFRGVKKAYNGKPIISDLSFSIEAGTFSVIYGAPACGKSVLLRLMTGLEKPDAGQILLRGQDATSLSPGERNIGYVPQSFALYPHYKVYDNIAYPLKLAHVPKSEIEPAVRQTAELLQIKHLLEKRPDQLSGGEKQRVAIARGIVKQTDTYVMDDPLTGLDFKLREQLFDDLKTMQETLKATFIYTTSDPLEALMLADRITIISGGRAVESGGLDEVYARPGFLTTMTLLGFPHACTFAGSLQKRDGRFVCQSPLFDFPVDLNGSGEPPKDVVVAVRPQKLRLNANQPNGALTRKAEIVLKEDLGGELIIYLELNGESLLSVVRHEDAHLIADGTADISVNPEDLVLFEPNAGQRIGQGAK